MKSSLFSLFFAATNLFAQDLKIFHSDYLAKRGLSIPVQKELLPSCIDEMHRGFLENRYPANVIFSSEPWRYSIEAAENSGEYRNENLYSALKNRINSKKHVHRTGNESQKIEKLKSVHPYMLNLVSLYIDLFENNKNWFSMQRWFREGENSSEKGGLVFIGSKGLEAILVDTQWQKEYHPENKIIQDKYVYLMPVISRHIERIGNIHTHPKVGKVRDYAGPSGDLDHGPIFIGNRPIALDDMTCLTKDATTNPLQMDSVVSWIDIKTINVDVYFRNISFTNNVPFNVGESIVIDIGNFKVSK